MMGIYANSNRSARHQENHLPLNELTVRRPIDKFEYAMLVSMGSFACVCVTHSHGGHLTLMWQQQQQRDDRFRTDPFASSSSSSTDDGP